MKQILEMEFGDDFAGIEDEVQNAENETSGGPTEYTEADYLMVVKDRFWKKPKDK